MRRFLVVTSEEVRVVATMMLRMEERCSLLVVANNYEWTYLWWLGGNNMLSTRKPIRASDSRHLPRSMYLTCSCNWFFTSHLYLYHFLLVIFTCSNAHETTCSQLTISSPQVDSAVGRQGDRGPTLDTYSNNLAYLHGHYVDVLWSYIENTYGT
jgi:hypothetical protein